MPTVSEIPETKVSGFFPSFFSFSSFSTKYKIGSNSQAHTPIQPKFGTLVGCTKENSGTNFGDNTAKLHGDPNVYLCIQRSKFRHTYRVNYGLEYAGIWYVAGLNIVGVPFGS